MKRVMMDVFPTDWSPRNTSLYLASGARDVPPAFLEAEDDTDADSVAELLILFLRSNLDTSRLLLLLELLDLLFTNLSFSVISEVFIEEGMYIVYTRDGATKMITKG